MRAASIVRRLDWLTQARIKARDLRARPRALEAYWPVCRQCGEDLDAVSFEDTHSGTAVDFRGKHHGKEDVIRIELGVPYGSDNYDEFFRVALQSCVFFPRNIDS